MHNAIIYLYWPDQSGLQFGYRPAPIIVCNPAGYNLIDGADDYRSIEGLWSDWPYKPGLWRVDIEHDFDEDDDPIVENQTWTRLSPEELAAMCDGSLFEQLKAGKFAVPADPNEVETP